jgi:hypothetical protein
MGKSIRGKKADGGSAGATRTRGSSPDDKAMNFKVSIEFHTEFKTFAATHRRSMTELLREGFDLLKKRYPT